MPNLLFSNPVVTFFPVNNFIGVVNFGFKVNDGSVLLSGPAPIPAPGDSENEAFVEITVNAVPNEDPVPDSGGPYDIDEGNTLMLQKLAPRGPSPSRRRTTCWSRSRRWTSVIPKIPTGICR